MNVWMVYLIPIFLPLACGLPKKKLFSRGMQERKCSSFVWMFSSKRLFSTLPNSHHQFRFTWQAGQLSMMTWQVGEGAKWSTMDQPFRICLSFSRNSIQAALILWTQAFLKMIICSGKISSIKADILIFIILCFSISSFSSHILSLHHKQYTCISNLDSFKNRFSDITHMLSELCEE